MSKFRCENERCIAANVEHSFDRVRYVWSDTLKQLVLVKPILCKFCQHHMVEIPTGNTQGFCFNKFDSLDTRQKREIIHKRAQAHFRKHDKGDLANYKRRIIEDNKRMWEGRS